MIDSPETINLIGGHKNIQIMLDNHRNHIAFMNIMIRLGDFQILIRTLPWVYRTYHSQGFRYDYFLTAFSIWKKAINKHIDNDVKDEVLKIYDFMIRNHEATIILAESDEDTGSLEALNPLQEQYLSALVSGNQREIYALTDTFFNENLSIEKFYLDIIQPVMYRIGRKWEIGEISVAHEHIASAIIARILSSFYKYVEIPEAVKGRILISSAPNEYHEAGAWITANMFEINGWEVQYLGANTPVKDVVSILRTFKPQILAISVTMIYNIDKVIDLIEIIKSDKDFDMVNVFLGGYLFKQFPEISRLIKADYIAENFLDAIIKANSVIES